MPMFQINWAIVILSVSSGIILLLHDWRITTPALFVNYLSIAWFLAQQQFITPDLVIGDLALSTTIVVKVITGLAASLILGITGVTFSREYNLEDLDEFSLAELRRAARRAQRQRTSEPFRVSEYVVPFWALVLAAIASLALPRLYPIGSQTVDMVWYWLGLTGLFTIVIAGDTLKIGLGLLLVVSSIDLVYTAIASTVQVFPLALLSLTTIVLSLSVAYLSGLMYGRLKTLDLGVLYKR